MKTLSQYKEDVKALMKKIEAMDAKLTLENREPTEAEISLKNELLDAVEEISKTISTLERQERVRQYLESAPAPVSVASAGPVVTGGEPARSRDRFASLGEQLVAVMRASRPGGGIDPRLYNTATGLNEDGGSPAGSDGGFLVQTDFAAGIINQVFETGIIASRCGSITISSGANATTINGIDETSRATGSRYGGVRGYWMAEADEKTASKPKFRQIELKLRKLAALVYATDEVLADASQLESIVGEACVSELRFLLDDAILNGGGTTQPLGVLASGALVTQDAVSGQGAGTVIAENVISMWSRLFAASRPNAVWLINQEVEPQLIQMKYEGAAGGVYPVYLPPGGLSGAQYGTLFGRPVIPVEQCAALGTVGDIILGDFTNGYVLARKGDIKGDMSIHVRFIYDESVFRFVMRVDGQPVRASVLTPYKGSATQSHFVALSSTRT